MNFNEIFSQTKIIATLRGVPSDMLTDVLDVLYDNGIKLCEIPYDATDAISDEGTASDIGRAVKHMEGKMLIGGGIVLRREQVELTHAMGGSFITSPNTDAAIIADTKQRGLISLPGAMTVSEVCAAVNAGADYVELYPVSILGPAFVRSLLAPLRNAKLVAAQGITPANIDDYLAAGCVGASVGSGIVTPALCASKRLDLIAQNVQNYIASVNTVK